MERKPIRAVGYCEGKSSFPPPKSFLVRKRIQISAYRRASGYGNGLAQWSFEKGVLSRALLTSQRGRGHKLQSVEDLYRVEPG